MESSLFGPAAPKCAQGLSNSGISGSHFPGDSAFKLQCSSNVVSLSGVIIPSMVDIAEENRLNPFTHVTYLLEQPPT